MRNEGQSFSPTTGGRGPFLPFRNRQTVKSFIGFGRIQMTPRSITETIRTMLRGCRKQVAIQQEANTEESLEHIHLDGPLGPNVFFSRVGDNEGTRNIRNPCQSLSMLAFKRRLTPS